MDQLEKDSYVFNPDSPDLSNEQFKELFQFNLIEENDKSGVASKKGARLIKQHVEQVFGDQVKCHCGPYKNELTKCGDMSCCNKEIYAECDETCDGPNVKCLNRQIARGDKKKLRLVAQGNCGFSVVSCENITSGELVTEYVGTIYTQHDNPHRKSSSYAVSLLPHTKSKKAVVIEPTDKGNISRFLQHSHDANCIATVFKVGDEMRLGIFAKTNIPPDTTVTLDYGNQFCNMNIETCACSDLTGCPDVHVHLSRELTSPEYLRLADCYPLPHVLIHKKKKKLSFQEKEECTEPFQFDFEPVPIMKLRSRRVILSSSTLAKPSSSSQAKSSSSSQAKSSSSSLVKSSSSYGVETRSKKQLCISNVTPTIVATIPKDKTLSAIILPLAIQGPSSEIDIPSAIQGPSSEIDIQPAIQGPSSEILANEEDNGISETRQKIKDMVKAVIQVATADTTGAECIRSRGRPRFKDWNCEVCGKKFNEIHRFTKHLEVHFQVKDIKCTHPGCTRRFNSNETMLGHLHTHKSSADRLKHECRTCRQSYVRGADCQRHMNKSKCPYRRYKRIEPSGSWRYGDNKEPGSESSDDEMKEVIGKNNNKKKLQKKTKKRDKGSTSKGPSLKVVGVSKRKGLRTSKRKSATIPIVPYSFEDSENSSEFET